MPIAFLFIIHIVHSYIPLQVTSFTLYSPGNIRFETAPFKITPDMVVFHHPNHKPLGRSHWPSWINWILFVSNSLGKPPHPIQQARYF